MRRALVPLLAASALHCGDATSTTTAGAGTSTTGDEPTTTTAVPTTGAVDPTSGASDSASDSTGAPTTSGASDSASDGTGAPVDECATSPLYRVGAGIADVTGPSAELVMMGYSMPDQKAAGISTRLWARAFVVESKCSGGRVVFVSADLGQVFQSVHLEVLKRLEDRYGAGVYTRDNVVLSATHTHSGLAGFSHYTLYNLAALGFDPDNFEVIVAGIVEAIARAHDNLGDGVLKIAHGPLQEASWNRSPQAYANNPADERDAHEAENHRNVNTRMTVLRMERTVGDATDGEPIGALAWFSSHATSVSNANRLVSSDHKGLAALDFERSMGADYLGPAPFVAAFAQSDAGDVSPNEVIVGDKTNTVKRPCDGSPDPECTDLANAAIHADIQYARARELFDGASELLRGPVDGRLAFHDMENVTVDGIYTGDGEKHTCSAAIGISLVAGAEDGIGVDFIKEGISLGTIPGFELLPEDTLCHAEKTILLPTGRMVPVPWTPPVVPATILRLGNLAIVATPFEVTTISGDRLRATVLEHLAGTGVDRAVIAGLSNGYSSYVATRDEYRAQNYEGASTLFGPWTLAAWQQHFAAVADALRDGTTAVDTGTPKDLSDAQTVKTLPVVADSPCALPDAALCPFQKFGDVVLDPPATAAAGEHVVVRFRGAHPRNDIRTGTGYLEVQRKDGDAWQTIARDWDPETTFRWARTGGALSPTSEVTIDWRVPQGAPTGEHRIVYHGDAKSLLGTITPISGTSPIFVVQ